MDIMSVIIVGLLFAWACHYLAGQRNRNQTNWAIGGFLFGIFALVALLLVGVNTDKS